MDGIIAATYSLDSLFGVLLPEPAVAIVAAVAVALALAAGFAGRRAGAHG